MEKGKRYLLGLMAVKHKIDTMCYIIYKLLLVYFFRLKLLFLLN